MTRRRLVGVVALAAAAGGLLTGCEVREEIAATCVSSPPAPHQEYGVVAVTADIPLDAVAGGSFTITVTSMGAYAGPPGGSVGQYPTGTLSVTGPVSPSGTFAVGQGLLGGTPYPNTLTFQATGAPGETIEVRAVSGMSYQGTFPNLLQISCTAGPNLLRAVQITAPPGG